MYSTEVGMDFIPGLMMVIGAGAATFRMTGDVLATCAVVLAVYGLAIYLESINDKG